jgi:hypothetical protein
MVAKPHVQSLQIGASHGSINSWKKDLGRYLEKKQHLVVDLVRNG